MIGNLFTVGNSQLQIKTQKQTAGCTDCGVFSIANATTIVFGQRPAKLRFQQDNMRAHSVNCLQKNFLGLRCKLNVIYKLLFIYTIYNIHA